MAYTDQQVFDTKRKGKYLSVQANSGTLLIETLHNGNTWLVAQTITTDFVGVIEGLGDMVMRFTPEGGATYEIH